METDESEYSLDCDIVFSLLSYEETIQLTWIQKESIIVIIAVRIDFHIEIVIFQHDFSSVCADEAAGKRLFDRSVSP